MISLFINDRNIPCTILKSGPCYITQIKNLKKDGYKSIQIGFIKKKKYNKPTLGHFKKSKISPKKIIKEFKIENIDDFYLGQKITVNLFKKGELVKITSLSKGKGFQGVVKKHGFSGVGERTHGQHNRLRAPGSIGAGSDPSRVFKGTKMAGKMGNKNCTIKNIEIIKINEEKNFIIVKGSIPGGNRNNSYVIIEKLWK